MIVSISLICYYMMLICFVFFFFSSRRRHTRFDCDWSSDVCSSDTVLEVNIGVVHLADEVPAEDTLHESGRDAEPVGEEGLGSNAGELCHRSIGLPGPRSANPNVRSPAPQVFWIRCSLRINSTWP